MFRENWVPDLFLFEILLSAWHVPEEGLWLVNWVRVIDKALVFRSDFSSSLCSP